jgi:peptide/nickel transport system ATP-binding protein
VLTPTDDDPTHAFACFYPVGSAEGDDALARNLVAGRNAAGLELGTAQVQTIGAN